MTCRSFIIVAIVLSVISWNVHVSDSGEPSKIVIGHAAMSPKLAPLWLAKEQGIFNKYNLDAEIVFIRTVTILISGLTTGRIDVGVAPSEALVLASVARGLELRVLAAFNSRFNHDLVTRPGIEKPEDLRGKRFGIQSMGGGVWMRSMLALEYLGLNPERDDIRILAIGDQTVAVQALERRTIDAATLDRAFSGRLKEKGFPILLDLYAANIPTITSSVVMSKTYLEKRRDVAENVLKALIEGLAFTLSAANKDTVIKTIMKHLKISDSRAAEEGYQDTIKIMEKKPYPSIEGIRNIHRLYKSYDALVTTVKFEDVVDTRILKGLDENGFIDQTYKRYGLK